MFSSPKILTNILMTYSIHKNTLSCFSLNCDILPLLKGHFNWHSEVQERDLFSCKTLWGLDYCFTFQHFLLKTEPPTQLCFPLSYSYPSRFSALVWLSKVVKILVHGWAESHFVLIIIMAFCKPRKPLILGVYDKKEPLSKFYSDSRIVSSFLSLSSWEADISQGEAFSKRRGSFWLLGM